MGGKNRKILCLDDDTAIQGMYRTLLHRAGFPDVVTADDGREGLRKYRESPADYGLILTDFQMPGMDGMDFLKEIKNDVNVPPRVMLSATVNHTDYLQVRGYGAKGLIIKPFEQKLLLAVVDELLLEGNSPTLNNYLMVKWYRA